MVFQRSIALNEIICLLVFVITHELYKFCWHGQKFRTFEPAGVSAVANQKIKKTITKMADRSRRKCGKVDYRQLNSVHLQCQ